MEQDDDVIFDCLIDVFKQAFLLDWKNDVISVNKKNSWLNQELSFSEALGSKSFHLNRKFSVSFFDIAENNLDSS